MSLITLNNQQYIQPVIWRKASLCDFATGNNVDMWRINVNDNLTYLDAFLNVLNPEEITRAGKYYRESDCNRFIVSRGMLRFILSKYTNQPPAAIKFKLIENNKPFVIQPTTPEIHFNLSDSANQVVIAIARSAIGIDVEYVNPNFGYNEILHNNFNEKEAEYINEQDSLKRFFLLWTRKEAILKATGIGLTDHLKLITALDGEYKMDGDLLSTQINWQLNSFEIDENYPATIAANPLIENYSFWNIDLNIFTL